MTRAGALATVLLIASSAAAQDPNLRVQLARARQSAARLEREIACLQVVQQELHGNAERVLEAIRGVEDDDGPRRREAEIILEQLEARRAELYLRVDGCRHDYREDDTTPSGVTLEEHVQLSPHILIEAGRQVSGEGQIDPVPIRNSLRTASARFDRCYAVLVRRESMDRGSLTLHFTLDIRGRASQVAVEGSEFPERFNRCVLAAGRRIRAPSGVRGGDAAIAYTLRFHPAE